MVLLIQERPRSPKTAAKIAGKQRDKSGLWLNHVTRTPPTTCDELEAILLLLDDDLKGLTRNDILKSMITLEENEVCNV